MDRVVMKFGGAALATPEAVGQVAERIVAARREGVQPIVVVSAMGNTTNELLALAQKVHPSPPKRELDLLVTAGERISMALLAMALDTRGVTAKSFTGSQSGIITTTSHNEAQIVDVRPIRIEETVAAREVPIIAGFQGVSGQKEVTTLGRGGSDTTAVALAVALNAVRAEFYKDVDGFFDKDPKVFFEAVRYEYLPYDAAAALAKQGAKILHERAILLASKNHLPLHVKPLKPSSEGIHGTWIGCRERGGAGATFECEAIAVR